MHGHVMSCVPFLIVGGETWDKKNVQETYFFINILVPSLLFGMSHIHICPRKYENLHIFVHHTYMIFFEGFVEPR